MSLFNIFSKNKKPVYQSQNQTMSQQPIQGSGYGSNYASNASNYKTPVQPVKASNYSTQNYLSSLFKQPTVTPKQTYSTPQTQAKPAKVNLPQTLPWGTNTGSLPWGFKSQPSYSGAKAQPQMSVAPKQNMSVNPNPRMSVETNKNYRPPTNTAVPRYEAPAPQADLSIDWMNYVENAADRQLGMNDINAQNKQEYLKALYGLSNQQLGEALPQAEADFGRYKANTEASIADLIAGGERQKSQAEDYYGDAQRQAAQTLRETQGQTSRMFANLGTLDSRGEGSFAQANENTMSDFNRYTQQNLKAKADQLAEIDSSVGQAERSARETIAQEESKMNQLKRDIYYAQQNNNLNLANDLVNAYNESQQYIYDVEDALAQTKYQFGLEQQKLENEIALLNTPGNAKSVEAESKLRAEFFNRTKDNKYNEVAQTYDKIINSKDSAAGDLGLIFSYMKLLDPSSTVREGEFANAQNATGIPSQVMNAYNRAVTGERINPAQREDFRNSALAYVTQVIKQQQEAEKYYRQLAEQQGLNPDNIVGGYGIVGSQNNQSTMSSNDPLGLGI